MSVGQPLSAFFVARQILEHSRPDLFAWSASRWEYWLQSQRSMDAALSQIVAVACLTCLNDLPLHLGLMQLLPANGLGLSVVLTFPTDEMARLARAQARREGWHGLVHFLAEDELEAATARLCGNTIVAVFRLPTVLHQRTLDQLKDVLSGTFTKSADLNGEQRGFTFCEAKAFEASKFLALDDPNHVEKLSALLAQDAKDILTLENPEPSKNRVHPAEILASLPDDLGGVLDVPLPSGSGVLLVAVKRDEDWDVIVRQRTDLTNHDRPLDIRVPASCLKTYPQPIRIETRDRDRALTRHDLLFQIPPSGLKPWMLSAFLNRGGAGNPVVRAFAQGVGCRIAFAEDEPDELRDSPVVWGVLRGSDRILAQAKAQALYFFYIDHAYFNRGHGKTYRITRNGYEAGAIRKCPNDRIAALNVDIRPWRKSGREVIVCPPTEFFMQAHNCCGWLEETLETLRRTTDRPVVVRAKPQSGEQAVPLSQALGNAHALVTHSSNVAIEAACLGTPVFVAPASAAASVGLTDLSLIETPVYPDRDQWLAHLAYSQFSFEEIADGTAWRLLIESEERDFA